MIINPSFQFLRVPGITSFHPDNGGMTFSRWRAAEETNGKVDFIRNTAPLSVTMLWNSSGWGGLFQPIERDESEQHIGSDKCVALDVRSMAGAQSQIIVDVLAWNGVVNKPTINPVTTWGPTLSLSAGWSLIGSFPLTVTGTEARVQTPMLTIPDVPNIAVLVRAIGIYGDQMRIRRLSFDDTPVYQGYDFVTEQLRNEWFYQYFGTDDLYGIEAAYGLSQYATFTFPLHYPLRGRTGIAGREDIDFTWAGSWFAYGGGTNGAFVGTPNLSCHHRNKIVFGVNLVGGNLPGSRVFTIMGFTGATVTVDAELRP